MARNRIQTMVNMSLADDKRQVMRAIGLLDGWWELDLSPRRGTITQQQRRFYFSVLVQSLSEFLHDHGWDNSSKDFCHQMLKSKLLQLETVNPDTGEIITTTRSIMDLGVGEMADYIDRCMEYLASEFSIICPEPDPAWRQVAKVQREKVMA